MIAICFFVDSSYACGRDIKTEKWLSVCRSFNVDKQLVIDRTAKECFYPAEDPDHPAEVYANFNEVLKVYPNTQYVMIERQGPIKPTPLPEYKHREKGDVIYCFGPDGGGLEGLRPPHADWVIIPMSNTVWGLWAVMAATIVMNDRWTRGDNR